MGAQTPGSRERTYILPKDAIEGDRLDLQHHLLRYALQGDFAAPIERAVRYILDVGCGTRIWGEEMALDFPDALIVDLDLYPPSRTVRANLPIIPAPNHHFVQANLLHTLPFGDDTFDFTHQRLLGVAIPEPQWPDVIQDLIRVTRPGGWVELLEAGYTLQHAGPATLQWLEWAETFLAKHDLNFRFLEDLGEIVRASGLREVESRFMDLPLGGWDPYVGLLLEQELVSAWIRMTPTFSAALGIPVAELDAARERAVQEWVENRVTFRFVLVYGQV